MRGLYFVFALSLLFSAAARASESPAAVGMLFRSQDSAALTTGIPAAERPSDSPSVHQIYDYIRWRWEDEVGGDVLRPRETTDSELHFHVVLDEIGWDAGRTLYYIDCALLEFADTEEMGRFSPSALSWFRNQSPAGDIPKEDLYILRTNRGAVLFCVEWVRTLLDDLEPYERDNIRWKREKFLEFFDEYTPGKYQELREARRNRARLLDELDSSLAKSNKSLEEYKSIRELLWRLDRTASGVEGLHDKLGDLLRDLGSLIKGLSMEERNLAHIRPGFATRQAATSFMKDSQAVYQLIRLGDLRTFIELYHSVPDPNGDVPVRSTLAHLLRKMHPDEFARADTETLEAISLTIESGVEGEGFNFSKNKTVSARVISLWVYRDLAVADVEFEREGGVGPVTKTVVLFRRNDGSWQLRGFFGDWRHF